MKKPPPRSCEEIRDLHRVRVLLRQAREIATRIHIPRAAERIRLAQTSLAGAIRHAERLLERP